MATFVPKRVALLLPWLIYGSHPPFIMRRPIKFYKIEEIGEVEDFRFGEGGIFTWVDPFKAGGATSKNSSSLDQWKHCLNVFHF